MKRQTEPQGVVTKWVAKPLDVDPFRMPACFSLKRAGWLGRMVPIEDKILLTKRSVLIKTYFLNNFIEKKVIKIQEFSGISIRISVEGDFAHDIKVSVNLHHDEIKYCIPLHFAFNLDFSSARLQTWSKNLNLPILLPDAEGHWFEPIERLGRLVIKAPYERMNRANLTDRRSFFSRSRETHFADNTDNYGQCHANR